VALPRQLIQDAVEAAPAELRGNLNRLVLTSLREFTVASTLPVSSQPRQAAPGWRE